MKVIPLILALLVLCNCSGKNNEAEKLKAENEQLKSQVNTMEKAQSDANLHERYLTAMKDIKLLMSFIESYTTDWSKPPVHASFTEMSLDSKIVPYYIKKIPTLDPWGNEYRYKKSDEGEYGTYWIGCAGSDGVFNGFDQTGDSPLLAGGDIILSNGEFKLIPK